MIHNFNLMY